MIENGFDTPPCLRLGDEVCAWLRDMSFRHFVTFNFNQDTTLEGSKKALKGFLARWDRWVLGKRFNRLPKEQRTFLMGFVEHIGSNLHYHALVRPAGDGGFKQPNFVIQAPGVWTQLIPSGQLYIPTPTAESYFTRDDIAPEHLERISAYITKDLKKDVNYENFVISNEFLPSHIR